VIGLKAASDRDLLDALALLVDDLDPTPESVAVRARSALVERSSSEVITLRLLSDSVHAPGRTRELAFTGLDLRFDPVVGGWEVTGPARAGTSVVARWPGGQVTAAVSAGRFHVERVPFGPVRFVLRGADASGRDHVTPWFVA
jgi:hypothetical protein